MKPILDEYNPCSANPIYQLTAGLRFYASGFALLFRNPGLLALSLVPVALTIVAIVVLLIVSVWIAGRMIEGVSPVRDQLRTLTQLLVLVFAIFVSHILYVPLARVFLAPFAEAISRRTSAIIGAPVGVPGSSWIRSIIEGAKLVSLQLAVAILAIALSLTIPVVGGFIGVAFAIFFVSLDYLDVPLSVRGLKLREKLKIIGGHKSLALGFGMAGYVMLVIPIVNLFSLPVGVVGATLAHRAMTREDSA